MSSISFLIVAVLAQPLPQRVEVHGGASTFWYTAPGNRWDPVRGDVQLVARRPSDGAAFARLTVSVLRGDDLWTVELPQPLPDQMFVDADLDGPVGRVHAAAALRARVRVTRNGEILTQTATLQAFALTTGFHENDGTFRMLPQPRSADLELLVHVEDVPGAGSFDIGFDRPEIFLDGIPVAPERAVVAATARTQAAPAAAPSAVTSPWNTSGAQPVAGTVGPTSAALAAAPLVVGPPSNGGTQASAGAIAPTSAAPAAAPSVVGPPSNGGGAQASAGTVAPPQSAPAAAPSAVAHPSNGGGAQANAATVAQPQSVPAAAPSVVGPPSNGGGAQASTGTIAPPQPASAAAPSLAAPPANGGGVAAPANAMAESTRLVVSSP